MTNNFKKTVDLKEEARKKEQEAGGFYNSIDGEDSIYKIKQPERLKINYSKLIFVFLSFIFIFSILSYLYKNDFLKREGGMDKTWYAIKLVDGETFYGQAQDTLSDPLVVYNAYYNYDKQENKEDGDVNNLRLVKRGGEAYGPDGSISIIRSQVLYLEPLAVNSKVLKAILEYEK